MPKVINPLLIIDARQHLINAVNVEMKIAGSAASGPGIKTDSDDVAFFQLVQVGSILLKNRPSIL